MDLQTFLKNNKDSRKIFGKKELEIIFKQLNGMRLTQSEKNRLSRDIRTKFKIIKELNQFKEEFKLERNQINLNLIKRAKQTILNDNLKKDIKAILLFGSFANNTNIKKSDIDICVVFKKEISLTDATKFRIRMLAQLPKKIDIQVFNILPQKLKKQIVKNHKILFKTKEYDNTLFLIRYLKDKDYFIRMKKIFGIEI